MGTNEPAASGHTTGHVPDPTPRQVPSRPLGPHRPRALPGAGDELRVNRAAELSVFVRVAELGSFSAAAQGFEMTPSAVSKIVARLEQRLGVRLLQRSTRQLQLTPEGRELLAGAKRVLGELNDLEHALGAQAQPQGLVRLNTSSSTGQRLVVPLMPRLMAEFPRLRFDLSFTDHVVDLIEAQADIAIRWGRLPASDLVARRLGQTQQVLVASPAYLAAHGVPRQPSDLAAHVRIGWNYPRAMPHWPLRVAAKRLTLPIGEQLRVNDGEVMRHLALAGAGVARLSLYHAWDDLRHGRLRVLLQHANPGDLEPIHAVYPGRPDQLPPRTRAVLDFLQAHVDLRHAETVPPDWCES
ncbi:LysR family transcriptional regulator [Comamonas serinivorans]|uniref:LysR family transcriptional regulator n=1 Tax=Comamonas serinivorans TaxID=1082851 RepID=A0A1Y0ERR0_9BURK|nr:LysR family transcriptional regulator [Comamonas serinivorans]ARU06355.1 LysR family transcriptional regulator [Comamonas serinivorans]